MIESHAFSPDVSFYGTLPSGELIEKITLRNSNGVTATLMTYGASLNSLTVPLKNSSTELTLGFDSLEEYVDHPFYFGCTIGRVANRITACKFDYGDTAIQLICNENAFSHLHGGSKGFDKVVWLARPFTHAGDSGVEFTYFSPDGEEGYRGNLSVKVIYILTEDNELKIFYQAVTDFATPLNLTNHTYWNLDGAGNGTVLNHRMQIFADRYLEINQHSLPTGRLHAVAETDFDLREPVLLRERMESNSGYDHYFVLPHTPKSLCHAAQVLNADNTCRLDVYTTEAGLQFYTGNYLEDYVISRQQRTCRWGGFCLETQAYPDAVNHPHFPSIMLLPEQEYLQETVYKLSF